MAFSKNWVFTLNNPQEDSETLMNLLSPLSGYCIFQKEQGTNGTQHYQGYIQFTVRKRLTAAKSILPRAHWEVARGSPQQCKDYCSKEETRLDGPYETGHMTVQGQRRDIEDFRDSILEGKCDLDLLEEHCKQVAQFPRFISFVRAAACKPRNEKPTVRCFIGASGSGKTRTATEFSGMDATYIVSRPDSGRPLWWDGYNPTTHVSVVLDDFYGWLPWSYLLQLLDRYSFSVEIKGGKLPFNSPNIFITSNSKPDTWYKSIPNNDMTPLLRRIDEIKEF